MKKKHRKELTMAYIIFDMDDTLLNDRRRITPYTLQVLKKLQAMGHKLVINTARSKQFDQDYFDQLRPDYAILNGGALIVDKDERTVYQAQLDVAATPAFIADLLQICDNFTVQSETGPYSHLGKYTGQNALPFDFTAQPFPYPSFKIVASIENDQAAFDLAEKHGLTCVSYFGGAFKRFNHHHATKAQGNRKLMELLGGSLSQVIAFGDDWGDLEMLQQAGIGVLMKNAHPQLHGLCSHISEYTNDQDGVARFLARHFGLE